MNICDGISIEVFLQGKYYDKLCIVSRGESSSYRGLVLLLLTTMRHCKGQARLGGMISPRKCPENSAVGVITGIGS